MSESSDYTPAPAWKGHDFGNARAHYDRHVGRSYGEARAQSIDPSSLIPAQVTTDSPTPFIIWIDVTGSMGDWPKTIFSKLPYLDHEMRTEYLGEGAEVCFGAVGDFRCDTYSLQVNNFTKGGDMKKALEALKIEGGGGGNGGESYEMAALYTLHNVQTPKADGKPIFVMIGDENPFEHVTVADALTRKVRISSGVTTKAIFDGLMERFEVYVVLKPYTTGLGREAPGNRDIYARWKALVGEDRIAYLDDPNRVVDVIFGIMARVTGKEDYFRSEIEGRQTKAQVKTVYKALDTIQQLEDDWEDLRGGGTKKKAPKGKSTLHKAPAGKKSKDLV